MAVDPQYSVQRTRIVWGCFIGAMTLASGGFILGDGGAPQGIAAVSPSVRAAAAPGGEWDISPREALVVPGQWRSIVIHHSATPAGDAESLQRQQVELGLTGLGYHFLIGNGQGLGDGVIHVGYRWNKQLAGAHVGARTESAGGVGGVGLTALQADQMNRHAIGICLVGNGNRRSFTPRQVRELVALVQTLQRDLGIPATSVYLHSDLSAERSPGQKFPLAEFESQLLR